ncbi:MAG: hypothetical protein RIT81_32475 [Deltaproteobacteria bacterium]
MTTRDELFLFVMHRFSEVFEQHAVPKGGMALRLLDSTRASDPEAEEEEADDA